MEGVCVLYPSPNVRVIKSRRLRPAGHVARMGDSRSADRALVGKPEGRRPPERLRRRWEDNIKFDLREVGLGAGGHGLDRSGLEQEQVTGCCECGYEP